VSPDPAAVSEAPLRFDRRAEDDSAPAVEAPEVDAPEDDSAPAVDPPEVDSAADEAPEVEARDETHAPAGPPPLRQPAEAAVVTSTDEEPEVEAEPTPTRSERRAAQAAVGAANAAAAPQDFSRRQRKQAAKRRARKVKRIVRRLDAWSVMKVAFIFNLCVYVVTMVAVVLLWNVATGAGVIDKVESFIEDLGAFDTFEFEPDQLLQATALGGAVLAVLATGLIALGAVLFNLISDLVGGIRLTVIEEPGSTLAKKPRSGGTGEQGSGTVSEPSGASSPEPHNTTGP
jgi:Transmembrane domain of unknown function (DUF3566)